MKEKQLTPLEWLEQMVSNMIINGGCEDLLAVIEHINKAKEMREEQSSKTPEYNLDELADEWVFETNGHKWSNNDNTAGDNYGSFKSGFQKAVEMFENTEQNIPKSGKNCEDELNKSE